MSKIEIPKQLREKEFKFILLHYRDKKPVEKWKENNYSFDKIKDLLQQNNYGIICGTHHEDKYLIVIDADSETINNLAKERLPETFTIKSGNSNIHKHHYYFFVTTPIKPIRLSSKNPGDLGDVRTKGQYVVGPNAIHPSGNTYKIIKDVPITTISKDMLIQVFGENIDYKSIIENSDDVIDTSNNIQSDFKIHTKKRDDMYVRLCEMPDYCSNNRLPDNTSKNYILFKYLADLAYHRNLGKEFLSHVANVQGHDAGAAVNWFTYAEQGKLEPSSCDKMREYIKTFHPNLLSTLCGRCRVGNVIKVKKKPETYDFLDNYKLKLEDTNLHLINPDNKVFFKFSVKSNIFSLRDKIVKEFRRYPPLNKHTKKVLEDELNKLLPEIDKDYTLYKKLQTVKPKELTEDDVNTTLETLQELTPDTIKQIRSIFDGAKQSAIFIIARYLIKNYKFKTLKDTKEIYVYHEGIYLQDGECIIQQITEKFLGERNTNNITNEVIGHIKRLTFINRNELSKQSINLICVNNGILDIHTLKLVPHSDKHLFLAKIPHDYMPDTKCEKIIEFLKQVINEDDIPVIQEIIGYTLYKKYPYQKAFMFKGVGSNGKSVLINFIKHFLGMSNCCGVSLQDLDGNRFAVANLYGKLANLFADLPSTKLLGSSKFKMLTGGDMIQGEKKFKEDFKFHNHAKMIFSANTLPKTLDDAHAFFRRWVIIDFPNKFDDKNKDVFLLDKLTTDEEMSGLLNWALDGLKRLLENNKFSYSKSVEDVKMEYIRLSDSIGAFVMDEIESDPDTWVLKSELYSDYCDYCRDNKLQIQADNVFHRELQWKVSVRIMHPTVDGKQQPAWKGIKVKGGDFYTEDDITTVGIVQSEFSLPKDEFG